MNFKGRFLRLPLITAVTLTTSLLVIPGLSGCAGRSAAEQAGGQGDMQITAGTASQAVQETSESQVAKEAQSSQAMKPAEEATGTQAETAAATVAESQSVRAAEQESGTQSEKNSGIYSDTDFNVPGGYISAMAGRQYGTSEQIEYYSTVSHKYKKAQVILPYGYSADKTYPVLYLLHGLGGDYRSWSDLGAGYIVQNAHYDYGTPDMIIVCPTLFTSQEYDSEDGLSFKVVTAQYDKFADELENDLMPLISSIYSVKTGKDNTAVAGYSLGGRESSYIGFRYYDQFGYVGGFSATNGIFKDEVWADAVLKGYDYTKLKNNYRLLFYQVGTEDPYIDGVREFKQLFDEYGIEYMYYEMPGDHEGSVWQHGLYNFARRLFMD